ncbi:MAG: sigma-70 family RNA polymerase sigma factor [Phycisphaerales bacterium]
MEGSQAGSSGGSAMVEAAIRGDADAVRSLWQEHRRWVAAVLLAHKPRDVELDDLLQDVAMTVVRTIGKLRDGGVLRPWLRTVAINAARASGREERRRRQGMRWDRGREMSDVGCGMSDVKQEATARGTPGVRHPASHIREESGRLLGLARQLPDGYREPLILKCVQGMSYREIGRVLDLPETTIETRIARARRMLRELAAKDEESGGDAREAAAPESEGRAEL